MSKDELSADSQDVFAALENADFSLDDNGEMVLSNLKPEAKPEVAPSPKPSDHDWEARYKNLEPEFTRKSQKLAELEKNAIPELQQQIAELRGQLSAVIAGNKGKTAQGSDEDPDTMTIPENFGQIVMQDPAQAAQLVAEIADRVARRKLEPILERVAPMVEDWEIEQEMHAAAFAPGREDFFELLPQIRDVIARSERELTFSDAYNIVKTFRDVGTKAPEAGTQPPAAQTPSVEPDVPATERRVSPDDARRTADRLAPDTGVAGAVSPEKRVARSVEEAFNMAVESLYGG